MSILLIERDHANHDTCFQAFNLYIPSEQLIQLTSNRYSFVWFSANALLLQLLPLTISAMQD